ncbi:MAG TPA: VOC family protein [Steroidobacteraceae bacterium]|jgi:extradiol dioxygenase family protein
MEPIISDMVQRYEHGRLSRRELIRGLTMLAAAAQVAPNAASAADAGTGGAQGAAAGAPEPIVPTGIDHISILVSDVARSQRFYQDLLGLSVLSTDKDHGIVRMGTGRHVIVSIRPDKPAATIDHFGVKVENFNKAALTTNLKQRGLNPRENWQYGFFVNDPDGTVVQFV